MMPLYWSILLLCLSANAENVEMCRETGEQVTLECSSAGCPSSIQGYNGMYLYHYSKEVEEVLFYYSGSTDKITPRGRYRTRIQTNGSLKNHTVTISNLTVDDLGRYSCVYKSISLCDVQCNVYTLLAIGAAPRFRSEEVPCVPTPEKTLPLVLIIITTCSISLLVTMIFILLIVPRVKQWTSSRRRTTWIYNDNLYEVMTKNAPNPPAAPKQSPPSP